MSKFHTADSPTEPGKLIFTDRELIRLIVPLIIEQALAVMVGMADTVMVSTVGEAGISGVSLVDMINRLIIMVFSALATGGAVVTSQLLGARNKDAASRAAAQLISLSALLGLAIMALSVLFRHPLLRFFFGSITDEVMEAALLYFLITALSFPFLAAYNAGAAIFRSAGNSAVSMRVSMFMNVFNVVGNAVCVFILHMGVAGVAIPTLVARALGAAIILRLAKEPGADMHINPADVFRFDPSTVRRILHIGIPSGIENGLFHLGRLTVVSMISTFGTVQIAANAVANNLDQVGLIVGMSMGLAMITVIGRAVGARDERQIRMYVKKLLIWTYIGQDTVEVLILLLMPQLLKLYSLTPETARLTTILVRIHLINGIFMWPIAFTLPHALRAANDIRYTMIVAVLSMLIWRVGFSYILCIHYGMGAIGVWVAMIIDWICRIICFVWRWKSDKWKHYCGLDK